MFDVKSRGNVVTRVLGMTENQSADSNSAMDRSAAAPSGDEIRKSLEAEIQEMEKYKWYLGEQIRHDPLKDRSLNDIYCEWVDKYAADFRKSWESKGNQDAAKKQ
jgi:hypothetical protein